jgi:EAL and modified HD-GYP domain-containing signal transduction protein
MVFGLGKLFGKKEIPAESAATPEAAPEYAPDHPVNAFVRREAIFDKGRKLAGHLFCVQIADAGPGDVPTERQTRLDDTLLRALCASTEAWGQLPAFLPLSSESLANPGLDRLPANNAVLLLSLAPESVDLPNLAARLSALAARGLRFGVFRQPRHPAFPLVLGHADLAVVDASRAQGGEIRDFSIAMRSDEMRRPVELLAIGIESPDDVRLCVQCRFGLFQGRFFAREAPATQPRSDPNRLHLIHLYNLTQGDAETAQLASVLKQDPNLTFRILRYLNSAAVALSRPVSSIDQALVLLGRQRLARWISVLLFSVRDPDFADWLLVESALARGRMMELLGAERFPAAEADHLFLTGVFSRLDKLLRIPLPAALEQITLPAHVRNALLERNGAYAPLLAVVEAAEASGPSAVEAMASAAGLAADSVNHALIAATAWANDVTSEWEA